MKGIKAVLARFGLERVSTEVVEGTDIIVVRITDETFEGRDGHEVVEMIAHDIIAPLGFSVSSIASNAAWDADPTRGAAIMIRGEEIVTRAEMEAKQIRKKSITFFGFAIFEAVMSILITVGSIAATVYFWEAASQTWWACSALIFMTFHTCMYSIESLINSLKNLIGAL